MCGDRIVLNHKTQGNETQNWEPGGATKEDTLSFHNFEGAVHLQYSLWGIYKFDFQLNTDHM